MRLPNLPKAWPVAAAGAALASLTLIARRLRRYPLGSQTNASDAMDDIKLRPNPTHDEVTDANVKHTFPASDPVAPQAPVETAFDKRVQGERHDRPQDISPPARSADWMLRR